MRTATGHIRRAGRRSRRLSVVETIIVAACLATLLGVFLVPSSPPGTEEIPATTVRVRESQTLWDLARVHPVSGFSTAETVELIRSINNMDESSLMTGQVVYVPAQGQTDSASLASR